MFWIKYLNQIVSMFTFGVWTNFSTKPKELSRLKNRFFDFSIIFIPHSENVSSNSLAKIAISFHIYLLY
ncbi:hypothetical protein IGI04_005240 [Brassica rapa subsp. trilocularis]|uniref:Uncharacterized protein n=1 Tax=Brassica rapa subsp. trilocularis TaxID=1813537 RepID=A0ABQ7NFH7_BRACM|nr:hypothetical protein IGI04_005240 [Brassica rapa subsp. trilocularis]